MAFVFRSPRNLDLLPAYSTNNSQHQNDSPSKDKLNETSSKDKGKHVVKKPHKMIRHKPKVQSELCPLKEREFIQELDKNEIKGSRQLKSPKKNEGQYFFKSKCKRGGQLIQTNTTEAEHDDIRLVKRSKAYKNKNQSPNINRGEKKNMSVKKDYLQHSNKQNQQKFPCLINKQIKCSNNNVNLLQSKRSIKEVFTVPSIPGKDQKYGYVLKENQLSYPQMVSKPRYDGSRTDFPGPTDYQIIENRKTKGVLKFQSSRNKQIRNSAKNQLPALVNDQEALKLHNQKIKKWVREGKQKIKQQKTSSHHHAKLKQTCETRDLSVCSDQSGETVYQDDTTPGPGYYSYSSVKDKKNFRSKNEKFAKIFLNKSQRFEDIPVKINSLCYEYFSNPSSVTSLHLNQKPNFFISRLERKINIQNQSIAPPPGHYDVRISMQNDIISKIIKNSPNLFNNNLPRLANTVFSITPGPGTYKLDPPNFKVESFRTESIYDQNQLTKLQASFKACQKFLVENMMRGNEAEIIHKMKDGVVEQIKSPPFLSSSSKDLSLNPKLAYITQPAKHDPLSPKMKPKQNIYPFNSSQLKSKQIEKEHGADVGLYQNSSSWDKKSFSVLFN